MRTSGITTPDWLLFRKGDTFGPMIFSDDGVNCCMQQHGRSVNEPLVFGAYDPAVPGVVNPASGGARPIIQVPSGPNQALQCQSAGCDRLAIVGLKIYAYQADPTVTGRVAIGANGSLTQNIYPAFASFFLMEDTEVTWFSNGVFPGHCGTVIRRSIVANINGQGIDSWVAPSSGSFACSAANPVIFEENIIDHNAWNEVTGTATVTPGSPLTVTWPNAMGTNAANDFKRIRFSPGCSGLTAGTDYYAYNNTQPAGVFNVSSTSGGVNTPVNGTCSGTQTITWMVSGDVDNGFLHNIYMNSWNVPGDTTTIPGPLTLRGNLISNGNVGADQLRTGGTFTDNAWVRAKVAHNFGNPSSAFVTTISNNVYLAGYGSGVHSMGSPTTVTSTTLAPP